MSVRPPRLRFMAAMIVSVLLHAALIGAGELARRFVPEAVQTHPAPALQALLLPARLSEPMLKNTLPDVVEPVLAPSAPARSDASGNTATVRKRLNAAQRKLAEHLFYPPQAIAAGLEGEVRLLLRLAPDGAILEASIASSSGYALLDQAALNAALAMRRLPDAGVAELILPVVFQLQ